LEPISARRVEFSPYPFGRRPLKVQVLRRRLPDQRFPDTAAFRRAYFQAAVELVEFELV
jgi:hypothetical protein